MRRLSGIAWAWSPSDWQLGRTKDRVWFCVGPVGFTFYPSLKERIEKLEDAVRELNPGLNL